MLGKIMSQWAKAHEVDWKSLKYWDQATVASRTTRDDEDDESSGKWFKHRIFRKGGLYTGNLVSGKRMDWKKVLSYPVISYKIIRWRFRAFPCNNHVKVDSTPVHFCFRYFWWIFFWKSLQPSVRLGQRCWFSEVQWPWNSEPKVLRDHPIV